MPDHDPKAAQAGARQTPGSRRSLLVAGIGAAAAAGLSGCVIKQPEAAQPASAPPPATQAPAATRPPDDAEQPAASPPAPAEAGPAAAKAADVPKGGGKVLENEKVVLTRDASGQLRGFTAVCTHAGCLVKSVADGTINCPCHGSKFDAKTGQPVAGPAKAPLKAVSVRQSGDSIYLK
ncbi:Rieske (2Fe-2S) protein [Streptomyces sp. NPDC058701]|uniref:Rieske (2Fe-2S) protein n=1 Tax=Streptomyces sp. NPDC058701 TaxID=3346608 RepID=UPI00364D97DF